MSLAAHLTEQLDAEADASRQVIERIPESILDWRPHEKSWTTLELATHIANLVTWGMGILTTDGLDFESAEAKAWKPPTADTVSDVLDLLSGHAAQVRSALSGMSDDDFQSAWTMRSGEHVIASDSKLYAFTRWVLSHQAHHRGELMIYLRLNGVALPPIYGPTADEQ